MIDDNEKVRRVRALDLARRQAEADAARLRHDGVAANNADPFSFADPSNPNVQVANDPK